jgi:CheY-like chemotaxis protein
VPVCGDPSLLHQAVVNLCTNAYQAMSPSGGSFGLQAYKPDAIETHAYLAAAREAGAEEVLTKPFDMNDLLAAVRRRLPN